MNADIRAWGKETTGLLKNAFDYLNIEHVQRSPSPSASVNALRNTFGQYHGVINRVSFRFPKHLVFVHKGVGKGVPAGFSGSTTRKPKPWFNPVVEYDIDRLADIVAENQGDMIVENLTIR